MLSASGDGGGLTGVDGGMNAAGLAGILTAPVWAHVPGAQFTPHHRGRTVAVNADGRAGPVERNTALAEAPAAASDLVELGLLPVEDLPVPPAGQAKQMRTPIVDAFGPADGWAGRDGPWCRLRIDPAEGTVAALTSNASTGAGLWGDLGRQGPSIPSGSLTAVPGVGRPQPDGCSGVYRNGDIEYSISPDMVLDVDGEQQAAIAFHDGLSFSLRDIQSGLRMYAGRCLADPETGRIDRIQVNGRLPARD